MVISLTPAAMAHMTRRATGSYVTALSVMARQRWWGTLGHFLARALTCASESPEKARWAVAKLRTSSTTQCHKLVSHSKKHSKLCSTLSNISLHPTSPAQLQHNPPLHFDFDFQRKLQRQQRGCGKVAIAPTVLPNLNPTRPTNKNKTNKQALCFAFFT